MALKVRAGGSHAPAYTWSTPNTLKNVYQHTFSEERRHVDEQIDDFFNTLLDDEPEENPEP